MNAHIELIDSQALVIQTLKVDLTFKDPLFPTEELKFTVKGKLVNGQASAALHDLNYTLWQFFRKHYDKKIGWAWLVANVADDADLFNHKVLPELLAARKTKLADDRRKKIHSTTQRLCRLVWAHLREQYQAV